MNYPQEILPKKEFAYVFPIADLIPKFGEFCLCYRLKGFLDDHLEEGTFRNKPVLKTTAFENPVSLSNNLLGGGFLPEHVKFIPQKTACNDWEGGFDVDFKSIKEFIIPIVATPIFFAGSSLHKKEFFVDQVSFPDSGSYKSFKDYIKDEKIPAYEPNLTIDIKCEMRIRHVPTLANYWHVQLEVHPEGIDKYLTKDNGVWRRRIYNHLKENILTKQFKTEPVCDISIPAEMYIVKTQQLSK